MSAPVAVFTYNRYDEIMRVMTALSQNIGAEETDVYVFSNAPVENVSGDDEAVARIRRGLKDFAPYFHSYHVECREKNEGSNANMYDGINQVVNRYGRVIVLEDDILTAPAFLSFMNQALDAYEGDPEIFSVCGYNPVTMESRLPGDSFAYGVFRSWGWATWKDRWNDFSMEEEDYVRYNINIREAHTEAIMYMCGFQRDYPCPTNEFGKFLDYRLTRKQMADHQMVIYSKRSLCDNIGMDGLGLTTPKYSGYHNPNFDPEDQNVSFVCSKARLSIDSDREYFYRFRREEFVMEVYERTNLDRMTMYKNMYYGLARLMILTGDKKNVIAQYFEENNWKNAAIYGWGEAGKLLYELLRAASIEVTYIIDRRMVLNNVDVPVYADAIGAPKTDVMLITAIRDFWNIEERLYGSVNYPLLCMDDLVNDCLRREDRLRGYE